MIIVFAGAAKGQTGTTANISAIAAMFALEEKGKLLLMHAQHRNRDLEHAFLEKEYVNKVSELFKDTGLDGLYRFSNLKNKGEDSISRYTTNIISNKLDLLIGSQNTNSSLFEKEFFACYSFIKNNYKKEYRAVFIDAGGGSQEIANCLLAEADLAVINANQNMNLLEEVFGKHYPKIKERGYVLIGNYNNSSRYSIKAIEKGFKVKERIGAVYYNREFADAYCEGRALEFIIRNYENDKQDYNYNFVKQLKTSVKYISKAIKAKEELCG